MPGSARPEARAHAGASEHRAAHLPPHPADLAAAHSTPEEREDLELMLGQARRFVARNVDSAAIDRDARIPPAVLAAAAEAGLFGLTIPAEYGGLGFSLKAACRVVQELARADRSVAVAIGLHLGLGTRALVEYGTDEQKARWLPALASGERVASFGATEAQAGSDLAALRTTATPTAEGLRLDGEKCYVTNGGFAGLFTVLARTPGLGGARTHGLLCVPRETPGVRVGPEEHKLGIRGSSTVTVTFDDARVPRDALLGDPGHGMAHAHRVLEWGRTIMSAGCVGMAQSALELSVAHLGARRQFGRALGDFVAPQAAVAQMAARVYAMEALVRLAGAREADGGERTAVSMAAKVFCSEGAFEACDTAVQLHGALGFIEPVGVARLLRDCRITRIFEGSNDVLLVRFGTALLVHGPAGDPTLPALNGHADPALYPARDALDTVRARIVDAVERTRARHGVAAVHRQLVLQRLARAEVCRLAACAAFVRGIQEQRTETVRLGTYAAELLLRESARHLEDHGRDEDEARAAAVARVLLGGEPVGRATEASREARP